MKSDHDMGRRILYIRMYLRRSDVKAECWLALICFNLIVYLLSDFLFQKYEVYTIIH